jgi:cyclomaltodextrin glucanotransferase
MARLDASDQGFIDANNWLFTARGIPVIYYGSEIGFMRSRAEHQGNRNYFGIEGIAAAQTHPIHAHLQRIARVRAASPALQRGVQLDVELQGERAAFYRAYQHDGVAQTALVLLNKGDAPTDFRLELPKGAWHNAFDGAVLDVAHATPLHVGAHDVAVWLMDAPLTDASLLQRLRASKQAPRKNGG